MKFKLFLQTSLLALRQCMPLLLIMALIIKIAEYIDSPSLYTALSWFWCWMFFGTWFVFVKLRRTPHRSEDFFLLKASAKDLYWAAWWPWFVLREFRRRRGNFR